MTWGRRAEAVGGPCRGKIVEGRVAKIFKERALLEQAFIKDTSKTVAEHIKAQVAAIGENIQVPPPEHPLGPTMTLKTLLSCMLQSVHCLQ